MGSFNVGCGISNLSINEGERVGFILLDSNPSAPNMRAYVPNSFIYTTDLFKPVMPPIFGVYDDYGRISHVDKSATTSLMEKIYDLPIEKVLECLSEQGTYSDGPIFEYYFLSDQHSFDEHSEPSKEALLAVGFTQESDDEETAKYLYDDFTMTHHKANDSWHIDAPNMRSWRGKNVSKVIHKPNYMSELLDNFSEATDVFPGYDSKHFRAIKQLGKISGMFFLEKIYLDMVDYNKKPSEWSEYEDQYGPNSDLKEYLAVLKKSTVEEQRMIFGFRSQEFLNRNTAFPRSLHRLLTAYENPDELKAMFDLITTMTSVNRMFLPSYSGEQFGNSKASLALNKSAEGIINERIARYPDEDEDFENED